MRLREESYQRVSKLFPSSTVSRPPWSSGRTPMQRWTNTDRPGLSSKGSGTKVEDKERYEASKGSHSNGDALATQGGNQGQKGKKTGEKKEKKQRDMSKVKCWTCEKTGHFKRDCPDAEDPSKKDKTDGQANAAVEAEFEAFVGQAVQDATGLDSDWVIDSGATHHLSGDPKVFASR